MRRTKRATDKNPTTMMHVEDDPNTKNHSSVTLDQIEKELMVLEGNKGGKASKGGKGKGLWKILSSFE